jgi:hypothetical protein
LQRDGFLEKPRAAAGPGRRRSGRELDRRPLDSGKGDGGSGVRWCETQTGAKLCSDFDQKGAAVPFEWDALEPSTSLSSVPAGSYVLSFDNVRADW